jgi:hypothetical protein
MMAHVTAPVHYYIRIIGICYEYEHEKVRQKILNFKYSNNKKNLNHLGTTIS